MALTDTSAQRVSSGLNDGLQDGDLAVGVAAFADTPKGDTPRMAMFLHVYSAVLHAYVHVYIYVSVYLSIYLSI